jgi:predicted AAA+ superfamily ATPase
MIIFPVGDSIKPALNFKVFGVYLKQALYFEVIVEKDQIEAIHEVNYWREGPARLGFERTAYLNQVLGYVDSRLLKVLLGQRRTGKSTIFKQVIAELIGRGVKRENILYLNFELHQLQFVQTDKILADVIKMYFDELNPQGKIYLFFDEVQEVARWETIINSYLANDRYDVEIFLTGSNAHLLSTELSTYVTGRYVEISVFPFSFKEYAGYHKLEENRQNLIAYLQDSGIPELFSLSNERQKASYLMSLKDSILMNDVVKRFNVKSPKLLMLLLDFMIDNIGKLFSLSNIVNKLKTTGANLNVVTIGNYIDHLERTFLIHEASRWDVKGKKILEGERKYYLNDLGFSNYLKSAFDNGITRKLENYVYQALSQAGFNVYVGAIYNLEIDFVAERQNCTYYIQVTYLLHSQEVIDREYGSLEKIKDNWPKLVVSLDEVMFLDKNGIKHMPAWEFANYLDKSTLPG